MSERKVRNSRRRSKKSEGIPARGGKGGVPSKDLRKKKEIAYRKALFIEGIEDVELFDCLQVRTWEPIKVSVLRLFHILPPGDQALFSKRKIFFRSKSDSVEEHTAYENLLRIIKSDAKERIYCRTKDGKHNAHSIQLTPYTPYELFCERAISLDEFSLFLDYEWRNFGKKFMNKGIGWRKKLKKLGSSPGVEWNERSKIPDLRDFRNEKVIESYRKMIGSTSLSESDISCSPLRFYMQAYFPFSWIIKLLEGEEKEKYEKDIRERAKFFFRNFKKDALNNLLIEYYLRHSGMGHYTIYVLSHPAGKSIRDSLEKEIRMNALRQMLFYT